MARKRAALRHRRNSTSRDTTGQFNHAGQSEPGDVRIGNDGLRTGDRQRHIYHLGRSKRKLRAQRHDAGDGA